MAAARKKRTAKKAPAKRKVGRPSKRTKEAEDIILRALRSGAAIHSAAAIADIGHRTLYDWFQKDPHFRETCNKASSSANVRMAAALFARGIQSDTTAAIWWQKCRDPEFRDPRDQRMKLDVGSVKSHEDMAAVLSALADKVTAGEVPAAVLKDVADAFSKASDVMERADLEARIRKLEGGK